MGFLRPKTPKVPPPPTPASSPITARDSTGDLTSGIPYGASSLITTSSQGLKRKATTQKTSLIGG